VPDAPTKAVRHAIFPQLIRYGLTSGVALGADVGVLMLLKEVFGADVLLANTVGFSVGVIITFFASRMWVFSERKITNPVAEFVVFVLVGVLGLAINDFVVWAGTIAGWHYLVAKALAAGVSFLWNFLLRKYVVYR